VKTLNSGRQNIDFFAGWNRVFTYGVLQSILAFSFYAASCLALKSAFSQEYGLLIIAGTLGVYTSHLLIKDYLEKGEIQYFHFVYLLLLSAISACILFSFESGIEYLRHLLIPVIISILYLLPFSKIINSRFIPGWIKPASLAVSWTWICVGPLKKIDDQAFFYFSSIFFLILSNALMFDVKDMEMDKLKNKSTFANRYGWKLTQQTAFLSLLISVVLFGLFYQESLFGVWVAPLVLGLYFIPLKKIKTESPQNQYYWYLDGALFLFPIAVYFIDSISNKF
jgi:4-hydroxybenzoate polyprenyltransferase